MNIVQWTFDKITSGLNKEVEAKPHHIPLTDFDRLSEELHLGDVLLVEGRSRISKVIKSITYSPWTHSALYIGRIDDFSDGSLKNKIAEYYTGDLHQQLIIEAMLGEGTIIKPVSKYKTDHLRICRPRGISKADRDKVIACALTHLGYDYDLHHLIDLARFLLPYSIISKRWHSTLFNHNPGEVTKNVCSYMLGEAFASVSFPIMPVAEKLEDGQYKLYKRNTKLLTPKDFDYSPYFDIIKYPFIGLDEVAAYRSLPWDTEGMICNSQGDCFVPPKNIEEKKVV
jgi:permuted papain-like amidase YaeF/Yiix C92 family enzyme